MAQHVMHPHNLDIHAPTRSARRRFAVGSAAFLILFLAALAIGGVYMVELFAP